MGTFIMIGTFFFVALCFAKGMVNSAKDGDVLPKPKGCQED